MPKRIYTVTYRSMGNEIYEASVLAGSEKVAEELVSEEPNCKEVLYTN